MVGSTSFGEVPPKRSSGASVLLVDDVPANLLALESVLEPLGCELVRAHSGEEALRHLLRQEFALILIDVMMPGLDGLATAELIKKRASTRHAPIIFLTAGDVDRRDMAQAYARGAVDYLIKPLDPDILRSKVSVFAALFLRTQELKAQTALAHRREGEALENRRLYEHERGARTHAESVARAREDAIAMVSHDLGNPMTAIQAHVDMLGRKLEKGEPDLLERVEGIRRGMARMNSLVRDLLDTARIQSGSLTIETREEDVGNILQQAADLLRPSLAKKGQQLDLKAPSTPVLVACDRERILQVLSNLIENASKFSPNEARIVVEVTASRHEVTIAVLDGGCGIASEQVAHIFEPYWQASPLRRQGLGLGLAIAKGIVTAHGSRIWVESEPGVGSQFHFTLPLAHTD